MLAAFALHGAERREEAAGLLGLLSEGLPVDKTDSGDGPEEPLAFDPKTLAVADRVLAETKAAVWAIEIMDAHHFTTPGLMSVLNAARLRSGVLAPAQFAFLKLVDRRLWYALHALGFESDGLIAHPHPSQRIEAIGARAHWAAERAVGAPIPTPEFDAAIAAIRPNERHERELESADLRTGGRFSRAQGAIAERRGERGGSRSRLCLRRR